NQGFPISKIIIFGSYSKKTFGKESDIDICLVSPKFGKDPVSELQFLLKQSRRIDDRIEPIPISAKDYQNSSTPLIFEIKKYGITV
ncbi:MAG: nucleotidyltransferase domain-containing protein, partial [Elusimicrobiota bacterium]